MYARHLHVFALLLALTLGLWPSAAAAWVETTIRSHTATVDLDRAGRATVGHTLVVKVSGGPLKSLRIDGVDDDAELNPDATVARVLTGSKHTWPLLVHKSDDGSVTLEVDDKKGLGAGVYHFEFSYRSNFVARDLIEQRDGAVYLSWVGPRLADGIDSAKAVFRLPRGDSPPRLPSPAPEAELNVELEGLLVSQVRRGADKDELELVRAHVAQGEPALWRFQASARSFDAFTPPEAAPIAPAKASSELLGELRVSWLLLAIGAGFAYACLVGLKWSSSRKLCRVKRAEPRSLVPIPSALRAALAGVVLGAALLTAAAAEYPTLAGVLLVTSMLLAALLPPRLEPRMRGPGNWARTNDAEAFRPRRTQEAGRWLDSGSLPGFCVFVLGLAAFCVPALLLFPHSPYHALVLVLGSACLLPVFCTGRAGELPPDPVARPRKLFASLARRLRGNGWKVTPLSRFPEGQAEPDELRLLIEPEGMPPGLIAIELGLEYQVGSGTVIDLPCLIVRAREDSPAYYALPRSVVWSRGRSSSERVALLRPKLPTRAMCAELTEEVVKTLAQVRPGRAQESAPKSAAISLGNRLSTSKSSTRLPVQRM
ncbi:MAG TPA: hypothetical protein VI197_09485 [Polyangiaceae bacterium]